MAYCEITPTGFRYLDFDAAISAISEEAQRIFGADINIDADTMDGALIATVMRVWYEAAQAMAASYASISPATAVFDGLSRNVKINGIARKVATASTVTVTIIGTAGTVIADGFVRSTSGARWNLPETVTIPETGSIDVIATCDQLGSVAAPAGSVNIIGTPTRGWQSVNNAADAQLGAPIETDGQLRLRQARSTMIGAPSILDGMIGAIMAINGVLATRAYENSGAASMALPGGGSVPAHSALIVARAPDTAMPQIQQAIAARRPIGISVGSSDAQARAIVVTLNIDVIDDNAYAAIEPVIRQSVANYIGGLNIGEMLYSSRVYVGANLLNATATSAYNIESITVGPDASTQASTYQLGYDRYPTCNADSGVVINKH